jgi:iron complex transport system ATP-binding protein
MSFEASRADAPMLRAESLSVGHGHALFPAFDLELHAGELVCLLGRNGAGKTTLLKTLGGILPPRSGTVFMQGETTRELSGRERARRAALLLNDSGLPPFLLGRELVALGRTPHAPWFAGPHAEDPFPVEEAMKQLGCTHLAERRLGALSDGERQRLCLARALAQDAPLVLLDEPLAHLDLPAKAETLAFLREWTRSGRTVLAAVHEVDLALGFADRVLMLIPDAVPFLGAPDAAAGAPLLQAFPGWPTFWDPLGLRRAT